ncbi:endopeptidase La [Variovorax saccharolyticus]|uniref:endopeptidase La n=1 Tax=Variovorax saccharolyticus TaxID=3053516 RepID=UPI002575A647|nr:MULTISPECIES: endopeptidase La [unclassified Variovorax]MDM0022319.1 endopeptidase La [Variovorax sp. J22R187]MDM0028874.1 endopeptidase La [Variovorax sp. J31P216]
MKASRMDPGNLLSADAQERGSGAPQARPAQHSPDASRPIPVDALIILPVRNLVVFPGTIFPLALDRPRTQAAVQEAMRSERAIGVLLQSRPEVDEPGPDALHWVGTSLAVLRYVTAPDGTHHAVVKGLRRFRALQFFEGYAFPVAQVQFIEDAAVADPEIEGAARALKLLALETLELLPHMPAEVGAALEVIDGPAQLADVVASVLDVAAPEKQALLETFDLRTRIEKLLKMLARRIQVLKVSRDITERTRESIGEVNRKHLLREQMRAIQTELGEGDETAAEYDELDGAITDAGMPAEVESVARKEFKRLQRMPESASEQAMVRTYLDWLTELPWKTEPEPPIDIAQARRILDQDHFGLEKVKKRILEYLAVRKLNPKGRGPILCFVGPPGVGKTSLGQSIARATGRKFARISLGGVHDESEIRGHRRTYVGALPGNVVQNLRKTGTRQGVMMLDEIDKLGAGGFQGDPGSALLEVLDPEQNVSFRDTYLAVPFDLSEVMFIATANVLDTIPGPLRDRMEVIQLPGYTAQEKLEIARRHLVPRQRDAAGLTAVQVEITDAALTAIIEDYTREAGVRNLERAIGSVWRHVAMRFAEGSVQSLTIAEPDLRAILGARRFEAEVAMRSDLPGVATGLAWTPVGGDILFIEAARTPGGGRLILTGQLGEVMKESAQAALSLAKARAASLGIAAGTFEKSDIHIHVPAGATPKDGPSAGVAMFIALVSLLTGKPVRSDVAMTGEVSLRGLVLPIGGVKEKVLAALRAGITTVMLPDRNRNDLDDIPAGARSQLQFVWLQQVDEAIRIAIPGVAERP